MAVLGFPGVVCMRCLWYFSSDYHQKWPRTHITCKVTPARLAKTGGSKVKIHGPEGDHPKPAGREAKLHATFLGRPAHDRRRDLDRARGEAP